ncbi:MAG: lysylphosphatidylglycerol synthase transmembrane domain-containing protein [Lachnospiraceae bacterium]|nr:lysylphosphatidylglycerol synthase transmembrane domain-containing protein [Lachnospiraceae bacterium]
MTTAANNHGLKFDKKKIWGNIFKWGLIIGLLAFACYKNQEFMKDSLNEVSNTPVYKLILCMILANLFFIAEGCIISKMTSTGEKKLTIGQGISCTYMCAFYRLTTLGSGNGIAQLYYYNTKGIPVAEATGMSISQYAFQKITIGLFGVASFIGVATVGSHALLKYTWFMLAGVVVISFICLFLFLITVSKTISDFVMWLARKIVKPTWKLHKRLDSAQEAINSLQSQSRLIWKDKTLFLQVVFLNVFKFACWYIIPGILFIGRYNINLIFALTLMAVCNMLGCVMLAPSGVGTLDYVFSLLFGTVIPDGEVIAATIVLYRFFTWIVPFLIGIIPAAFLKKEN